MTQTVSSLLQWTPSAFKTPITSSRYMQPVHAARAQYLKFTHNYNFMDIFHNYRIVKTFEELVSHYVQQSRQNESHFFNFTSVILATERVSPLIK